MKTKLIAVLAIFSPMTHAATLPTCEGDEFKAFRSEFLSAAKANDKQRLVKLISFPVEDWSTESKSHDVQTGPIKDQAEFLQRYDTVFTAFMRNHLPNAKLLSMTDGRCALTWRDGNAEFLFQIEYSADVGFRVTSYDIGPY